MAIVEITKRKEKLTVRGVRDEAICDQNAVSRVLRAYRAKRMPPIVQPWDEAADPAGARQGGEGDKSRAALVELVRLAKTHEERDEALREIAAQLAGGQLDSSDARVLQNLLAEMRLQSKDARDVPPPADPERTYLVSEDGGRLVAAFERIVSDDRRGRLLEFAAELLEEDVQELPSVDPVGSL